MQRRTFLQSSCALAAGALAPRTMAIGARRDAPSELDADVAIVGGGLGGCAAALAAARAGKRVVLTDPFPWLGGQLTSQAVPPDENRWIEEGGAPRSYRALRQHVRDYYVAHYPLSKKARKAEHLNPGGGSVSRLCAEPRAWLAALEGMLAPHVAAGRLTVLLGVEPAMTDIEGDRVRGVTLRRRQGGELDATITARVFLDATENGELLPLSGTEFVTGGEAQARTREPSAPTAARPDNNQAFTWCFAMEFRAGEDHTIDRPASYDTWRDYVPKLSPPWTGKLLSLEATHPITLAPRRFRFAPNGKDGEGPELFRYRQILDPNNFEPGALPHPVTIVNWPQNDYLLGHLLGGRRDRAAHEAAARELSLSLFYWLQTEAPRGGDKQGWKGLRLRGDLLGSTDGLALAPYVRESRRIRAEFTVCEQHVSPESRALETGEAPGDVEATPFPDSVGIGHYRIDLHPTTGGDNYLDVDCLPFQVPLGSLLPVRVENLLPAAKNIGTTHITNGAYRLHPVEWSIGEAAGTLAAFALEKGEPPRAVRAREELLAEYQKRLTDGGMILEW
ncbi:MAG: FAD-dependent oxidoreductase [bacterium]|nr:FAD-dependent oxidoreductase [bacterium]